MVSSMIAFTMSLPLFLSALEEILNLGLAKHNVGVAGGVLVHVRLLDDEEDVLGLADGHSGDSSHLGRKWRES